MPVSSRGAHRLNLKEYRRIAGLTDKLKLLWSRARRLKEDRHLRRSFCRLTVALALGRGRRAIFEPEGDLLIEAAPEPVTVSRDRLGIPDIHAETWSGAAFAMGFAHGSDRLAQMEFLRRLAAGRLAEIAGSVALSLDVAVRTIGYAHLAHNYLERIDPETRRLMEAYAKGVNAAVDARAAQGRLPVEYEILDFHPEPWTVLDSLLISRLGTTDVNLQTKVLISLVEHHLAPSLLPILLPFLEPTSDGPVTRGMPPGSDDSHTWGSNAWTVAGSRTRSGLPLVATDPHVGLQAPCPWYAGTLRIGRTGESVAGFTFVGAPVVVLGRNRHVAWGATNMLAESADLFYEDIHRNGYRLDGMERPLRTRQEVIRCRDAADHRLHLRSTHRGALISDADLLVHMLSLPPGVHVSLAWPAFHAPMDELTAFWRINRAEDLTQFSRALDTYGQCALNFLAADRHGHIGQFPSASLPRRRKPARGTIFDGRVSEVDWRGVAPPAQIPNTVDPPEGFLVNANDLQTPGGNPDCIGRLTCPPYRGNRLRDLLAEETELTVQRAVEIQSDCTCTFTLGLVRRLLPDLAAPRLPTARLAHALLRAFDGRMAAQSASAAVAGVFSEFFRRGLLTRILGHALGCRFAPKYQSFPVTMALLDESAKPDGAVTADFVRTAAETALHRTAEYLTRTQGKRPERWQWGRVIRTTKTAFLGHVPVLGRRYRIGPLPGRGSAHCPWQSRFTFDPAAGTQRVYLGVTGRLIMSLADDTVLACIGTGQSETPFSSHFADQSALTETSRFARLHLNGRPRSAAARTLMLHP